MATHNAPLPTRNELDSLYNKSQLSVRQIAERTGLTERILCRLFKTYSIPRRSISAALQACHHSAGPILSSELSELYLEQKLSVRTIAQKYHCGFYWVWKCLRDNDIELRPARCKGHKCKSIPKLSKPLKEARPKVTKRACIVCGRKTYHKTFCSRFCSNSPAGKQYRGAKIRAFLSSLPMEEFNKWITRASQKPNKWERQLDTLLQDNFPGEWKFVGDGSLIIERKNPDFVNINGKKQIIELWGNYWHKGDDPQERIGFFKKYGYRTLILWGSELRKPQTIVDKVISLNSEV